MAPSHSCYFQAIFPSLTFNAPLWTPSPSFLYYPFPNNRFLWSSVPGLSVLSNCSHHSMVSFYVSSWHLPFLWPSLLSFVAYLHSQTLTIAIHRNCSYYRLVDTEMSPPGYTFPFHIPSIVIILSREIPSISSTLSVSSFWFENSLSEENVCATE